MGSKANNLYTSSGLPAAGGFGRSSVPRSEFDLIEAGLYKLRRFVLPVQFEDLNTAASRWTHQGAIAGKITRVTVIPFANNSSAATNITVELNGTAITMPTLQVGAAGVAGTPVSVVPTAANQLSATISAATAIEVITDGGGSGVMPGVVLLEITLD